MLAAVMLADIAADARHFARGGAAGFGAAGQRIALGLGGAHRDAVAQSSISARLSRFFSRIRHNRLCRMIRLSSVARGSIVEPCDPVRRTDSVISTASSPLVFGGC